MPVTLEDMIEWAEQECRGSPIAAALLAFLKEIRSAPDTDTFPVTQSIPATVAEPSFPWQGTPWG